MWYLNYLEMRFQSIALAVFGFEWHCEYITGQGRSKKKQKFVKLVLFVIIFLTWIIAFYNETSQCWFFSCFFVWNSLMVLLERNYSIQLFPWKKQQYPIYIYRIFVGLIVWDAQKCSPFVGNPINNQICFE